MPVLGTCVKVSAGQSLQLLSDVDSNTPLNLPTPHSLQYAAPRSSEYFPATQDSHAKFWFVTGLNSNSSPIVTLSKLKVLLSSLSPRPRKMRRYLPDFGMTILPDSTVVFEKTKELCVSFS
jgi:hypothetical protein